MIRFIAKLALVGVLAFSTPVLADTAPEACGDKAATPGKTVPATAAKLSIPIEGMTCEGCANTIQNALMAIDGVYAARVDHVRGYASVSFDKTQVDGKALTAAITKAGYKAGTPAKPKA
jgi:copper chaperone